MKRSGMRTMASDITTGCPMFHPQNLARTTKTTNSAVGCQTNSVQPESCFLNHPHPTLHPSHPDQKMRMCPSFVPSNANLCLCQTWKVDDGLTERRATWCLSLRNDDKFCMERMLLDRVAAARRVANQRCEDGNVDFDGSGPQPKPFLGSPGNTRDCRQALAPNGGMF
jgi:hypothetical protein